MYSDGGWDLLNYPVDIKVSNARFPNKALDEYTLVVPQPEFHNVIYVLGLVKKRNFEVILHLMG